MIFHIKKERREDRRKSLFNLSTALPAASAAQRVGEGTSGKAMQSRKGEILPSFPS
jgi:hypothetical protein